jgi:hypothetical protein
MAREADFTGGFARPPSFLIQWPVLPLPPFWLLASGRLGATHLRHALHWIAHHTGLPIVLVAAVLLVVAFRLAKRVTRFAVEVALVVALLLVATKLGWISW